MGDAFSDLPIAQLANEIGFILYAIIHFFESLASAYIWIAGLLAFVSFIFYIFLSMRRVIEDSAK